MAISNAAQTTRGGVSTARSLSTAFSFVHPPGRPPGGAAGRQAASPFALSPTGLAAAAPGAARAELRI